MWIQRMGLRMSLVAMGSVKVVAGVAGAVEATASSGGAR